MNRKEISDNNFLFEAGYLNNTQKLVNDRANSCLKWYIRKACLYRSLFYVGSLVTLCCPLIASVIVSINTIVGKNSVVAQIITIILGVVSSIATGILALFHAQEKWTRYRSAAEYLKREITLYKAGINECNQQNVHSDFLKNIEEYMRNENMEWKNAQQQDNRQPTKT